ncbi:hypothetical protein HJG60_008664 [Phyllostomus discolor]|uniref:Uncharacterized protein n=1 Tax=Phyllostomus discolor TaxID=89673 RepID=A0A833YXD4_9CHIR|nr:hypothetical protein HJG60_008664 [Phyllostomus discolor]
MTHGKGRPTWPFPLFRRLFRSEARAPRTNHAAGSPRHLGLPEKSQTTGALGSTHGSLKHAASFFLSTRIMLVAGHSFSDIPSVTSVASVSTHNTESHGRISSARGVSWSTAGCMSPRLFGLWRAAECPGLLIPRQTIY